MNLSEIDRLTARVLHSLIRGETEEIIRIKLEIGKVHEDFINIAILKARDQMAEKEQS